MQQPARPAGLLRRLVSIYGELASALALCYREQLFDIGEILRPARRSLVLQQVVPSKQGDRLMINDCIDAGPPRAFEFDTGYGCKQINAIRRMSELHNPARLEQIRR